jgi:hypothetical protein
MSKIVCPLALLAAVLVCLLSAVPARAQATRTFVSAAGSDSNPCSITAPCRHFQAAVTATAAGGEVVALDPANYGSFTISQAISIEGQGWSYVAPAATGNAITINAGAFDTIKIHGVSLDGFGANANGIVFNTGFKLIVTDCVAQNFNGNGILMAPSGGQMFFTITNTIATNNAGVAGIAYIPPSGSTATVGIIDHVVASHNPQNGIVISTGNGGGATTVAISNSFAGGNFIDGIDLASGSGPLTISIDNTTIVGNFNDGIHAVGSTTVTLGRSVITGNIHGIGNGTSPNTFYSYQDNRIGDNHTDDGSSSLVLRQQN